MVRFPVLLGAIRAHEDDFKRSLGEVHIGVEILQGLQHELARRAPVGREEQADVLEPVKALACHRLSQTRLFALTLCVTALLDELVTYDFINALT